MYNNIFSCILSLLNKMNYYNIFIFMYSKLYYVENICIWIIDFLLKLSYFRREIYYKVVISDVI